MHPSNAPTRHAQRGFAYLWVLLLVAFMGLGLTVAVVVDATVARRSQEQALLAVGHQFRSAIQRYYESESAGGAREYPAALDELLRDNRAPGIRRHLRKVFIDPMTGKAEWGLMRVGGRIVGVYSFSAAMPIKQDHFEAQDMVFRGKDKYSDWVFTYPPDLLLRDAARQPGSPASAPLPGAGAASSIFSGSGPGP